MEISEATKQQARTAIRRVAGTFNTDVSELIFATIVSVDAIARTCVVKAITGRADTNIEDVSLTPDMNDGATNIPSVGSTVCVVVSTEMGSFIIAWSDLDSIILKGGNFGGLTKTLELQKQINKLNTQLQAVVSTLGNWVVVPGDGGAALKAEFAIAIAGKDAGDFTNIENKLITHGDK